MIRIHRTSLSTQLSTALAEKTATIQAVVEADRPKKARSLWHGATLRRELRIVLAEMAPGREYCMYCGDNHGTDIDHFEPLARNPLRTFDWLNHLLACSGCNSHHKGQLFPVDEHGRPLLIDPTAEDPFDHLDLSLSTGVYVARTAKGEHTIEVCGLNRSVLTRGRVGARRQVTASLQAWNRAVDPIERDVAAATIRDQPFADVCQAMFRQVEQPGAALVLTADEIALLRRAELRRALLT